jgi:hypothetical protein
MRNYTLYIVGGVLVIMVLVIPVALVLSGAVNPDIRAGYVGTSEEVAMSYTFERFSGEEVAVVDVTTTGALAIDYEFEIEEGSLELRVVGVNGQSIFRERFSSSISDTVLLDVTTLEAAEIYVYGNNAAGSFTVSWEVF